MLSEVIIVLFAYITLRSVSEKEVGDKKHELRERKRKKNELVLNIEFFSFFFSCITILFFTKISKCRGEEGEKTIKKN